MKLFIKKLILKISNILYIFLDEKILKKSKKTTQLLEYYTNTGVVNALTFNYNTLKEKTINYVKSMKIGEKIGIYRFSKLTELPNIYSSAYACMILSLYDELKNFSTNEKIDWINYFDSFQSENDGFFYDSSLLNDNYNNSDWWGKRHLIIHLINCYNNLGYIPKYKFSFLEQYYNKKNLIKFLDDLFLKYENLQIYDIDNYIMNIGTLLQYSRDSWNDDKAKESVKYLIEYLEKKIVKKTGVWGNNYIEKPGNLSRMVQFAYHLYPLFLYDNYPINNKENIIDITLKTQNIFGGYGVNLNSSACEDIDSIYLLIKLSSDTCYKKDEIKKSLQKTLPWVLSNMNNDGGFVFRRNEPLVYGHQEMSSKENESNMFATWFRTLSLAYLTKYLNINNGYRINRCPGYEF